MPIHEEYKLPVQIEIMKNGKLLICKENAQRKTARGRQTVELVCATRGRAVCLEKIKIAPPIPLSADRQDSAPRYVALACKLPNLTARGKDLSDVREESCR